MRPIGCGQTFEFFSYRLRDSGLNEGRVGAIVAALLLLLTNNCGKQGQDRVKKLTKCKNNSWRLPTGRMHLADFVDLRGASSYLYVTWFGAVTDCESTTFPSG